MSHARFAALSLLATSLLVGSGSAQAGAIAADLRSLIESELAKRECVGVSVAVLRGDEWLLTGGFGMAELEHGVRANADTLFRIGSITKQFTAAAVMRLVEREEIELDADFRDYLPDYPDPGAVVTVRHLLTHTSGIPSYTGLRSWRPTIALELSHDELLDHFDDLELEFEPGAAFRYNNSGYYLLGLLVEKVTGESYAEHVRRTFFEPLGLERTRYGSNRDLIRDRAQGYRIVDGELENDELIGMSQPFAAGGLLSSAKELVVWARALASGKVVSAESYRQMTTPHRLIDGTESNYGFGLTFGALDEVRFVAHGGGINGFNSHLATFPDHDLTIAVISNCEAWRSGPFSQRIARRVLGLGELLGEPGALGDLPVTHRAPSGWSAEATESSMRLAQYRIAADSEHRCIVYWFGAGGGGGESANLERWQGQFADGAKTRSQRLEVADGVRATMLAVEGTYVAEVRPGSAERHDEAGWTMMAAYLEVPQGPLYLKLVGPTAEIRPHGPAFIAWIRSFRARR